MNPLTTMKWTAPKSTEEVDPASVANPRQVRELLEAVRAQGERGAHLEAFFGCLYYAAMRPAEAVGLKASQCHLPNTGGATSHFAAALSMPATPGQTTTGPTKSAI